MPDNKRGPVNTYAGISKLSWIKLAQGFKNYRPFTQDKLERATGFALNGQQLVVESAAILACVANITDGFAGKSDKEARIAIEEFFRHYLRIRDESKFPGIKHAESTSDNFERAFIAIASQVINCIDHNRHTAHPPDKNMYFKIS